MIASIYQLGPYTVQLRNEPGIQCALYHVYLGLVKIGKSLSVPDIGCCQWLENQQRSQTLYAYSSAPLQELTSVPRRARQFSPRQPQNRKVGA